MALRGTRLVGIGEGCKRDAWAQSRSRTVGMRNEFKSGSAGKGSSKIDLERAQDRTSLEDEPGLETRPEIVLVMIHAHCIYAS